MKKNLLAFQILFSMVSVPALAIECPKAKLVCELQKLTPQNYYVTTAKKEAIVVGVNNDEPSNPPNSCEAWMNFSKEETGLGVSYHAIIDDHFLYAFAGVGIGAIDPQFRVKAAIGQELTMSYKRQLLNCKVMATEAEALHSERCFEPKKSASALSLFELPKKICFSNVQADFTAFSLEGSVTIDGKKHAATRALSGEDQYEIKTTLFNETQNLSGCDTQESAAVTLSFVLPERETSLQSQNVAISAQVFKTNDQCHSQPRLAETIEYKEIR